MHVDLSLIRRIREASQADRLTILLEGMYGEGASVRTGLITQVEKALSDMQKFRIATSHGYHMTVLPPDNTKKPSRKVIITENEFGSVTKKEQSTDVYAYQFLRDYLGLGGEEPYTIGQMKLKYPSVTRDGGEADTDWYDALAREIIKGVHRQIDGPGKKRF